VKSDSVFYVSASKEVPGEQGCFLAKPCKKGTVLESISFEQALPNLIHIDKFMTFCEHPLSRFCYRYSGDILHFNSEQRLVTDYINHSQNPNLLIYLGQTYALRDISADEELCADYRFLMHERFSMDCGSFTIQGFSAADADKEFVRATSELFKNAGK
jgi:hypothetical protein